jgi:hypothetical protein
VVGWPAPPTRLREIQAARGSDRMQFLWAAPRAQRRWYGWNLGLIMMSR